MTQAQNRGVKAATVAPRVFVVDQHATHNPAAGPHSWAWERINAQPQPIWLRRLDGPGSCDETAERVRSDFPGCKVYTWEEWKQGGCDV